MRAQVVLVDVIGRGGSGVVYLGETLFVFGAMTMGPSQASYHMAKRCLALCPCCRRVAVPAGGGQDPGV